MTKSNCFLGGSLYVLWTAEDKIDKCMKYGKEIKENVCFVDMGTSVMLEKCISENKDRN